MKHSTYLSKTIATLFCLLVISLSTRAINTNVWTGGGGSANLFWHSTANWQGGALPQAGDVLVFTNAVSLVNSNNYAPAGTIFGGITFAAPSSAFALNGLSVTLTNNITDMQVVTPENVNLPVIVNSPFGLNLNVTPNGVLNLNNVISGTGALTNSGGGTVNLNGSNTFAGPLVINAGTVALSQDINLPAVPATQTAGNIVINGGTLQALSTFGLNTNRGIVLGPTSGSGQGAISVNNLALIPNQYTTLTNGYIMANNGGGTGGLTKLGFGNLWLYGANTYSGTTSNEVGTVTLDFTQPAAPQNNIISSSSPLTFGGANSGAGVTNFAQLTMIGSANQGNSQTFNNTHITVGNATIRVNNGASQSATLVLNALDHDVGGYVTFVEPTAGLGNITTTTPNTHGILGGWATIASGSVAVGWNVATNWACNNGSGNIVPYTGFTVYSFANGYVKNVMGADSNIDFPATIAGATVAVTNDLDGAGSVNNVNSIVVDGGVASFAFLIGSNNTVRLGQFGGVFNRSTGSGAAWNLGGASANQTLGSPVVTNQLGAGFLTAGGPNNNTPGEISFVSTTTGSSSGQNYDVDAIIVDNGTGPVTVVQSGSGYVKYRNHNKYSGGTYILGGRTQMVGTDIGTANYGDALGTGPIHIFPGAYLYLGTTGTNGTVLTNDLYLAGLGTVQEADSAIRASAANTIASKIVLVGDSGIGGGATNNMALITGPVSGPFNMYWGNEGNVGGGGTGLILSNQCSYTGNTYMMGRIGTAASATHIALGENNALPSGFGYGNVFIGISGDNGNDVAFDLNGFNQTINGLNSGSAGSLSHDIVCNSSNATMSTLTFGNNDQSGFWGGVIKDNSQFPTTATGPTTARVAITKIGAGVETFTNANTYSGNTTISNGVLQLIGSGSIANSTNVNIYGGTFDASALAYSIPAGQSVNVSGGTFLIGTASGGGPVNMTNGTLALANALNPVSAKLTANALSLGGATDVIQPLNLPPIPSFPITFPAVTYNTQTGSGTLGLNLPAGFGGYVSNDVTGSKTIYVVLTNGPVTPFLTWVGIDGSGNLNSTWDYNVVDWTNTATGQSGNHKTSYTDGSLVTLNDTGSTNVVNITAATFPSGTGPSPVGVTVSNTTGGVAVYTFTGVGAIGGGVSNSLTKLGSGTLILDNTGGDTYGGGLNIGAGGMVQLGNNDAGGSLALGQVTVVGSLVFLQTNSVVVSNVLSGAGAITVLGTNSTVTLNANNGSFSGTILVTNASLLVTRNNAALGATNSQTTLISGSSLDVSGSALASGPVLVSGIGVTNADGSTNGAIYNGSASSSGPPAVRQVTLQGDTIFGCPPSVSLVYSNRWDIRGTGARLDTSPAGSPYKITKVGKNQVSLSSVTVDSGLGDIDVKQGMLSVELTTTGLGNPANTLTVENGASLQVLSATNLFNKNIVLNGSGIGGSSPGALNVGSGNNTIIGPMTLNQNVLVTFRTAAGGQVNGSLTLSNNIGGTGLLELAQDTNSILTLAGPGYADNHTGGTTIDGTGTGFGDTFIMNTINTNTGNALIENAAGGSIDNNGVVTPPLNYVGGNGTNNGEVGIQDIMWPGVGGKFSTFGAGNIDTGGGGVPAGYVWSLGSVTNAGNGFNDLINVQTTFDTSGSPAIYINPVGLLTTTGVYTLVKCAPGGIVNGFAAGVHVYGGLTTRYTFSRNQDNVNGVITLQVLTGVGTMRWNNASGDGLWNVANSQNWTNLATATPVSPNDYQFYQSDAVLLDDSIIASGGTNVLTITTNTPVQPSSITVNSTTNYTIQGPGIIAGSLNFLKTNSSTLTISSANTFNGTVTVSGGTLLINNTNALGAFSSLVLVTNGGTLDVGGPSFSAGQSPILGTKLIYISGWGVNSNGCVVNNSGNQQESAFENLTLSGNAAIGGNGNRWDVGRPATGSGVLSTGGNPYNLYKVGSNTVALLGVAIDTNLANIDVRGGQLDIQQAGNSLGNAASNVISEIGGTLEFYNSTTNLSTYTKQFVLNGNGVATNLYNENGITTINGNMTLNGNCVFLITGTALTNNCPISGSGGMTMIGSATMLLTNSEAYTGNTVVNGGTLALAGAASINNSTNLTLGSGAALDVSGRANNGLTLNSGASQILTVVNPVSTNAATTSSTVNGNLTNSVGCSLSLNPNATNFVTLTVNYNATLLGTTAMKLEPNGSTGTNDLLVVKTNLTFGGTLNVTNVSGTLAAGNKFKLFNAASYSGTFSTLNLPTLTAGLAWTNGLAAGGDGSIGVVSSGPPPMPHITSIGLNGITLSLTATNGTANATYYLLQTTNIALPLSQWTPVVTNAYDNNGNTTLTTNIVNSAYANVFYILSNTNN